MKAVIYSRVSTEEQNPRSQLVELLEYCNKRNYQIVKIFEENISGSTNPFERQVFNQMLEFVKNNKIDVIVIYDITRFYRPPPARAHETLELLNKLMNEYNILIEFVAEPQIEDPLLLELWRFIKSWIGGYERMLIKMRTHYGIERRRKENKVLGRPSIAAYYAAFLYNKRIKDLTVTEVELAKKQLKSIVAKYWNKVKKTKIADILAQNELAEFYKAYPNAPKSYITFYRLANSTD